MYKEIGSDFWLNKYEMLPNKALTLDFLGIDYFDMALLSTGRSAISFTLEHIDPYINTKTALIPSYTCQTVIQPFLSVGYEIYSFNVDKHLVCDRAELLRCVELYKPSVILLHGYFGFNTLEVLDQVIAEVRKNGTFIIEDMTQTLYSEFKHLDADFHIASLRKWGPLPDGGLVLSRNIPLDSKPAQTDVELEESKLKAMHAKYLYMEKNIGQKPNFLGLFREAEALLGQQDSYYTMGIMSKAIQANLNITHLRKQRRANYTSLLKHLLESDVVNPVFQSLPDSVVPLYFPVYVKSERRTIQQYLASHDIYCPVIWPKSTDNSNIVEEVNWIYENILAIPCDQRYNADDMERIANTLMEFPKLD